MQDPFLFLPSHPRKTVEKEAPPSPLHQGQSRRSGFWGSVARGEEEEEAESRAGSAGCRLEGARAVGGGRTACESRAHKRRLRLPLWPSPLSAVSCLPPRWGSSRRSGIDALGEAEQDEREQMF